MRPTQVRTLVGKMAYRRRTRGFVNRIIFWSTQTLGFGRTCTFSEDPMHSFINEAPGLFPDITLVSVSPEHNVPPS